ncbi:hypothetical protein FRC09_007607, partial [Ceratobasidium sp. 395]
MVSENDLILDESKLSGENGEIYLLQWLCSAEKALEKLSVDSVKSAQASTEAILLKCVAATLPFPIPGRPIRALVARCFLVLYSRGETRTLYDTVQACLKIAGESKSILLRTHALRAVTCTITTAGKAMTENAIKDFVKQLRSCLADKSMALQRGAAEAFLALHTHLGHLRNPQEIEQIVTTCVKSFDTTDTPTRRSLSRLIGSILASTQTPVARPPEPTKKNAPKKDQPGSDDDTPTHAATTTHIEILSPEAMLHLLATQFHKPSTHRRSRVAIAECYAALFATLGRNWVEANYATIAAHLLSLLDHPRMKALSATMNANTVRYERLLVRQIVGALLRQRTLSERGQIAAVRTLSVNYLSKWPAVMPGTAAPTPDILVACL